MINNDVTERRRSLFERQIWILMFVTAHSGGRFERPYLAVRSRLIMSKDRFMEALSGKRCTYCTVPALYEEACLRSFVR